MVLVRMVRGPARTAAAIPGYWTMSRMQRVRETATGSIAVIAARQRQKPFIPAVTATDMVHGKNTPPANTGAKATAGIAAIRIMNTPVTA